MTDTWQQQLKQASSAMRDSAINTDDVVKGLTEVSKAMRPYQSQPQDMTQRGTLQEFIEWAQGNFGDESFAVVSKKSHYAMTSMKNSGYGYMVTNAGMLIGYDTINTYFIKSPDENHPDEMFNSLSGATLAGIYFCDEPTEQAYAVGASRCSVEGAKVWITPKEIE
jgi:hypothetical protein